MRRSRRNGRGKKEQEVNRERRLRTKREIRKEAGDREGQEVEIANNSRKKEKELEEGEDSDV